MFNKRNVYCHRCHLCCHYLLVQAQASHIGSCLSIADILAVLYGGCMIGIGGILIHTVWETHKLQKETETAEEEKNNG